MTRSSKGFSLIENTLNSPIGLQLRVDFVKEMNRLIRVMKSQTSGKALKPGSPNVKFLERFRECLQEWEQHGFLTENTSAGLRVTFKSTLGLLCYLTKCQ